MTRMPLKLKKIWKSLLLVTVILSFMTTLVAYSPTLYRMFCAATGYGGTVNRSVSVQENLQQESDDRIITVHFDSNVAPDLDWDFEPEQLKVEARVGEAVKIYYRAKNNSDKTIVARAVYNVTPYQIAPYFFKIECFCFTEEKLAPGEEARMPLIFYVDEQYTKDKNVNYISDITLSYTFYLQENLSEEKINATRELGKGSKELDESLGENGATATFDNDAPRK